MADVVAGHDPVRENELRKIERRKEGGGRRRGGRVVYVNYACAVSGDGRRAAHKQLSHDNFNTRSEMQESNQHVSASHEKNGHEGINAA